MFRIKRLFKHMLSLKISSISGVQSGLAFLHEWICWGEGHKNRSEISAVG